MLLINYSLNLPFVFEVSWNYQNLYSFDFVLLHMQMLQKYYYSVYHYFLLLIFHLTLPKLGFQLPYPKN